MFFIYIYVIKNISKIITNTNTYAFKTTHVVNFGITNGYVVSNTFTVFFAKTTELTFKASALVDAPTGKNYKIQYISNCISPELPKK
jgi:hypothetical protein